MDRAGRGTVRIRLLVALVGVLALVLAGCPEDVTETPDDEPAVDDETPVEVPEDTPADEPTDDVALTASCTNEEVGYEVSYPDDWVVNEEGLPPCSAFDPEDVAIPEVGEIPADIAVVIHENRVEFERATDFESDPGVEVISAEETTVDGRTAILAELEHTGEGLYPEGWTSYAYHIDLDPFTLQAVTHDIEEAGPPTYEERRDILDAMVDSLSFVDVAPDETDEADDGDGTDDG